jgi:4-amino-4-deoxy-L-arabinose transferase-like glycosyltransferase
LAALPWAAVVPVALWAGFRAFGRAARLQPDAADEGSDGHGLQQLGVLWLAVSLFVISLSVTKYYHYLVPCLPPIAVLVALWLDRAMDTRRRSLGALAGALVGIGILVAVVRDAIASPTWLAHLTTYLYTGFWTKGAPPVDRLAWAVAPFGVGLLAWAVARRRLALGAYVLSGLLTTAYVIDDYLPAASESWSQRSALRIYFDERGPNDRLISWWFYYRGETFFTKRDVWVMKNADRQALADYIAEREGKGGALWFMTIESHANRLHSQLPVEYRDDVQEAYRNFHYVLLRVPIP